MTRKTEADLLNEVGPLLYDSPDQWQALLAEHLDVKGARLRDVRRGKANLGQGLLEDILALAERRAKELARARDALRAWKKQGARP